MSALARTQGGDLIVNAPAGARELGVRNLPSLRLAIGFRDPTKRGAPTKVDHLIAKDGQEGEFARAAAKFRQVYGEKPKFCDIRLMGSLEQSLDISYKAFRGGGDPEGDGGVMIAKGHTNFSVSPWTGGPDTLTVWNQDGTVEQVETAGLDAITGDKLDQVATELGLELYTTFRFGLPKVLGYGSFCEITSKGKTTTDQLWTKLQGWYGTFGDKTPWVMRPMLVVRPARARPVVKNKQTGEVRRIKSRIWVLDLVIPETEDEMIERLRDFRQLTSDSVDQLFGTAPQRALPAAPDDATEASGRPAGSQAPPAPTPRAGDDPEGGPEPVLLSETPPSGKDSPAEPAAVREQPVAGDEGARPAAHPNATAPPHLDADPGSEAPEPDWSLEPEIEGVEPTASPQPVEEVVEDGEFVDVLSAAEKKALQAAMAFKVPGGSFQGRSLQFLMTQGVKADPWILYALGLPWAQDPGFHAALVLAVKANRRELYDTFTKGGAE